MKEKEFNVSVDGKHLGTATNVVFGKTTTRHLNVKRLITEGSKSWGGVIKWRKS